MLLDWGWNHLDCCLSRTDFLGRKTNQVSLPLDGLDLLEDSEKVDNARRAGDSGPWGVSAVEYEIWDQLIFLRTTLSLSSILHCGLLRELSVRK